MVMLGGSVRCGALALAAGLIGPVAFAAIAADTPGAQRPAAPNNGGAAPLEIKLSLRNLEERDSVFAGGYEGVACQTERPAGAWTLPDFGDRQPLWALLELGGTKRLLVLDRAPETNETLDDLLSGFGEKPPERAAFFTKAYFDANGNGNLLDDPVIKGQFDSRGTDGYWARFGPIEASLDLGTGPFPYRFGLYAAARTNSTPATPTANLLEEFSCSISPASCYEGEATEDGKRYRIALVDLNANGLFHEPQADRLFLTRATEFRRSDSLRCADLVVLGGRTFRAAWNPSSATLTLSPLPGDGLCTFRLPLAPDRFYLKTEDKRTAVAMFDPAREVRIPAGTYTYFYYVLSRSDTEGNAWSAQGSFGKDAPRLRVGPTNCVVPAIGEPFTPAVSFPRPTERGRSVASRRVQMSVETRGAGKEEVALRRTAAAQVKLAPSRQRDASVAPAYTVVDAKGDLIAKGHFEFG